MPRDYEVNFKKAEDTFLYQMVYDPRLCRQVHLNDLPSDVDPQEFKFLGVYPHDTFIALTGAVCLILLSHKVKPSKVYCFALISILNDMC